MFVALWLWTGRTRHHASSLPQCDEGPNTAAWSSQAANTFLQRAAEGEAKPKHWGVKNLILWCIKSLLLSLIGHLFWFWFGSQVKSYPWEPDPGYVPTIMCQLGGVKKPGWHLWFACTLAASWAFQMFLALVQWSLLGGSMDFTASKTNSFGQSITILPAGGLNRAEICDFMRFRVFQDTSFARGFHGQ